MATQIKHEAIGFVTHVGEVIKVSASFQKRDLYIEIRDNPNYPETVAFECHQDRVDILERISFGDKVKVHFNLKGRSWENPTTREWKVFNTLQAWRVEPINEDTGKPKDPGAYVPLTPEEEAAYLKSQIKPEDEDDLPF